MRPMFYCVRLRGWLCPTKHNHDQSVIISVVNKQLQLIANLEHALYHPVAHDYITEIREIRKQEFFIRYVPPSKSDM